MPKLFYRDKPVFGIEISQTGLRAMAINNERKVLGYGSIEVDPARLEESLQHSPDFLAHTMQSLIRDRINGRLPSKHVVLSAPTSHTFTRSLNVPISAAKNLLDAVRLEAEQYIPIPTDDLSIDYQIIDRSPEMLDVLMSATPKNITNIMVEATRSAGLWPVLIEPSVSSVARLITETERGDFPTVIVDIGASVTELAILNKTIRVTGGASLGGNTFTLAIAKHLKVTLEEAHRLKTHDGLNTGPRQAKIRTSLEPHLDLMVSEIQKTMRYYAERVGEAAKIEQVVIVGAGAYVPGIGDYLTEALMLPARVANPWHALDFGKLTPPPRQLRGRYLTAVGLAMMNSKEIWQ